MNEKLKELESDFEQVLKNLTEAFEGLKAEIISMDKTAFKTEKRVAEIGERILVTNPYSHMNAYGKGDVATVVEVHAPGVTVKEWSLSLLHNEYEVIIEPEQVPIVEELPDELTPNEQRAALIEKAKKFVEVQKNNTGSITGRRGYDSPVDSIHICDADFKINDKKLTVVCLLRGQVKGKVITRGIAKCMPGDVFNEYIGKAIALARALEIPVPEEFLNAVQPTEVEIGMLVHPLNAVDGKHIYDTPKKVIGLKAYEGKQCPRYNGAFREAWSPEFKIINDTHAVYANGTQ